MEDNENKEESFFIKHIGNIVVFAILIVFLGICSYIWFVPSSSQECEYTDIGCYPGQGSKFDQ